MNFEDTSVTNRSSDECQRGCQAVSTSGAVYGEILLFLQKKTLNMKLTTLIVTLSCLSAQAFGVSPRAPVSKGLKSDPALVNSLRKQAPATKSALFRDTSLTRGGAVPGWAAYNEALDKNPLTAKACTSLVGWFLGDLLAQVCLKVTYSLMYSEIIEHRSIYDHYRYLLLRPELMSSASLLFPPLGSFTMDHQVTTFTTGSTPRFKEPMLRQLPQRLALTRSCGAQSL